VIVLSGCKTLGGKQNLAKTFTNWDLSKAEDNNLVVLEFEKPQDIAKAGTGNEDWSGKVKLAFLKAQKGIEKHRTSVQSSIKCASIKSVIKDTTCFKLELANRFVTVAVTTLKANKTA
jgi:hypothetical protein